MPAGARRPVYALDECEIDLDRGEVRLQGTPAPIGGRAFQILELLVRSAGELVTKNELMHRVWPDTAVAENTLQVHIASLRRALGPYAALLKTDSRRGYRLLGTWTARGAEDSEQPVSNQPLQLTDEVPNNNFPVAVTDIIGRTGPVRSLHDLISAYRVVTLVGPGGIGKTTLA